MPSKKDMRFVSDLDNFFRTFDETHPLSESQKAEIEKHRRVHALRDKKTVNGKTTAGTTEDKKSH
ncbi:MAG: hypothetical protein K0Q74_603 [Gammaproteobacteria bacterium]|jgi:hypothetical protein|nr:hypothetical protein [Gammaproteobacteria bacterium]